MKFVITIVGFFLLLVDVQAQPDQAGSWPPATIRILEGQILGGGMDRSYLEVELHDLNHYAPPARAPVDRSGQFQFYAVTPGPYEVRVVSRTGELIRRELITIQPFGESLEIRLAEQQASRPISGTISLRRLQVSVPKKAVREFRESVKALESGDCSRAIFHLKRALEIEPQFFEAHNNLGSCYMQQKRFDLALASFEEARALDAGSATLEYNRAAALLALQRHAEAEEAARRALRLDPLSGGARYVLGLSLIAQNRLLAEALEHFRQVQNRIPAARLLAAEILIQLGRATEAALELRQYLLSGTPERRQEVEVWLAWLETRAGSTGRGNE